MIGVPVWKQIVYNALRVFGSVGETGRIAR